MGIFSHIWDRSKDGKDASQRSFIRFAIITLTLFTALMFLKKDNIIRWIQAGVTINEQKVEIERLKRNIDAMDKRMKSLSSNKDSLETYARERFGFSKTDEDVYLLDK